MYGSYDTTLLEISCCHEHTADEETDNLNDVYYYSTQLGPTLKGSYRCRVRVNDTTCRHAHVTFDVDLPSDSSATSLAFRRYVACHETGHSVGLLHGEDAQPPITGDNGSLIHCLATASIPTTLGEHNAEHIDDHY